MIPSLQYLRHGKALCGKVFKRFVETFNYHNDFVANLKGDGDLPTSDGVINLDRTDPTHPVIRLNKNNLAIPAGGGGASLPGCFDIANMVIEREETEGEETPVSATFDLVRPYFMLGGRIKECPFVEGITITSDCIIAVEYYDDNYITINEFYKIGDLRARQNYPSSFTFPLYQFDDKFNVVCDFRNAPVMPVIEY